VTDSAGTRFSPPAARAEAVSRAARLVVDSTASDSLLSTYGSLEFHDLRAAASQHWPAWSAAPGPVLDPRNWPCDPRPRPTSANRSTPPAAALDSSHRQHRASGAGSNGVGARVCCWRMEIWSWPTDSTSTGWSCGRAADDCGAGTRVTGLVLLRHILSDTARLTGAGSVALSRCAITRAAGRSVPFRPLSGGSWSRF
jgi:hypothetical protein